MKTQSILSSVLTRMTVLFAATVLSSSLYALPAAVPTVEMPVAGVPVLQNNLKSDFIGNTDRLCAYGDAVASYSSAVGPSITPRANFGAGDVVTPQALHRGLHAASVSAAANGFNHAHTATVSPRSRRETTVTANTDFAPASVKTSRLATSPDMVRTIGNATYSPQATMATGNILTAKSLQRGSSTVTTNIARKGYISSFSSQVSSLNGGGIAVIENTNLGTTMAKAPSVIYNPDVDDSDMDGGDGVNGTPVGDAPFLLLLMIGAYALIIRRKKHTASAQ